MTERKRTADRLRHDIDHGRGGDKVNFSDPSAAPLGTDDEAAGTPPTEAQVRAAHEAEIAGRRGVAEPARGPRTPGDLNDAARIDGGSRRAGFTVGFAVFVAVLVALGALLWVTLA